MNYIDTLQKYNLKITPQRLEIVDILYKDGHTNIDNLYDKLKQKFPTLSLATVYKNLNLMCEKDFVSEVKIPNQKSVYELTKTEHAHIVCVKCGTILDLILNTDDLVTNIKTTTDYDILSSVIVLNGICPRCKDI